MIGSIVKNVRWRMTAVAAIVVLPLVALACSAPGGGGGGGIAPVPRPDPTSTLDRAESLITNPVDSAFTVGFSMRCGGSVAGNSFSFNQDATATVDAPQTVLNGEHFSVWVTPGDWTVPASVPTQVGTQTIASVGSFILTLPLSPHVQFVDAVMTSGIPADQGYPQLQVINGQLWYTLDGPMAGGATITLPRVRIDLIAQGNDFDEIDYGMAFMKVTARVPNNLGGNTAVGVLCRPTTSQPFNETFIVPPQP
jgi:hypothetical protein